MSYEKAMVYATSYNNKIYTFGGYVIQNKNNVEYVNTCEYYDMVTYQW